MVTDPLPGPAGAGSPQAMMTGGTGDGEKNPHIGVYGDISSFSTTKFSSFPNYMLLEQQENNRIIHYYECWMVKFH